MIWTATAPGQSFLTIRGKHAEGSILKASTKMTTHDFLVFLTLIGINPDAYKFPGYRNDFWIAEQTVPRCSVTGSEHSRNPTALRCCSHKNNWAVGSLCLFQAILQTGIPGNSRLSEIKVCLSEVIGTRTASTSSRSTSACSSSSSTPSAKPGRDQFVMG